MFKIFIEKLELISITIISITICDLPRIDAELPQNSYCSRRHDFQLPVHHGNSSFHQAIARYLQATSSAVRRVRRLSRDSSLLLETRKFNQTLRHCSSAMKINTDLSRTVTVVSVCPLCESSHRDRESVVLIHTLSSHAPPSRRKIYCTNS